MEARRVGLSSRKSTREIPKKDFVSSFQNRRFTLGDEPREIKGTEGVSLFVCPQEG